MTAAPGRFWFAPAPAERLALVRVVTGAFALGYLVVRLPYFLSHAGLDPAQFRPIGVAAVLGRPLPPSVVALITVATVLAGIPFLLGWRFRVTGPLFGLLALWTLTYRSSWGMVFHTENLMVVHLLVLGVTRSADAWSLDARRRPAGEDHARYGWPLRLMAAVAVATYLLAGVAKLRYGGVEWAAGDVLRNYVATDNLRKALLGSATSPLGVALLGQEWLFRGLAVFTLILELGAPFALLSRRLAAAWVVAAVGFHWGVLALMLIAFPYPMTGAAFACFFPLERLFARLRRRRPKGPGERQPRAGVSQLSLRAAPRSARRSSPQRSSPG